MQNIRYLSTLWGSGEHLGSRSVLLLMANACHNYYTFLLDGGWKWISSAARPSDLHVKAGWETSNCAMDFATCIWADNISLWHEQGTNFGERLFHKASGAPTTFLAESFKLATWAVISTLEWLSGAIRKAIPPLRWAVSSSASHICMGWTIPSSVQDR